MKEVRRRSGGFIELLEKALVGTTGTAGPRNLLTLVIFLNQRSWPASVRSRDPSYPPYRQVLLAVPAPIIPSTLGIFRSQMMTHLLHEFP